MSKKFLYEAPEAEVFVVQTEDALLVTASGFSEDPEEIDFGVFELTEGLF